MTVKSSVKRYKRTSQFHKVKIKLNKPKKSLKSLSLIKLGEKRRRNGETSTLKKITKKIVLLTLITLTRL